MYAFFYGKVENILNDRIILNVNNIGYEIYMPENDLNNLEGYDMPVKVYTHFHVREDYLIILQMSKSFALSLRF